MARLILLAGLAAFVILVTIPEVARAPKLADRSISHYLRGRLSAFTGAGFVFFALSLLYVATTLGPTLAGVLAALVSAGVLGSLITARIWSDDHWTHYAASAVAFGGALILMLVESRADTAMATLAWAYPVVTLASAVITQRIPVAEKLGTLMIGLWLVAYSFSL